MHPLQLGIDVAKAKLDCALRLASGKFRHKVIAPPCRLQDSG